MQNFFRASFLSGDDHLSLAPREHFQHPPPSYAPHDDYKSSVPRLSMLNAAPEIVMRDDERYPTPVEEHPGLHPYIPPTAPIIPVTADTASSVIISPISRNQSNLQKFKVRESQNFRGSNRKCCGLQRRIFFSLVIATALLVIAGIAIGVVVALKVKDSKTTRLPALTSSGLFVDQNSTVWNSQIVYVNTTTGKVEFRINNGSDTFRAPQIMNLTIVPATNTPMSLVSILGTDNNIYLNLFYIHNTHIILANISCAPSTCTTIFNSAISNDLTFPIHESSGLAALYLESEKGFRVFYHNSDRYLTQMSSLGDGWDHGETISGKAVSGSSISATTVGTAGIITVIYVEDMSKELYYTQFNATWLGANPVSNPSYSKWNELTGFTSCWQPDSDTLFVYFTGSDKLIYQAAATNASSSGMHQLDWGDTSHDLTWIPSNVMTANIGALAWDDQVRFYRLVGGQLAQSAMIDGVWSAKYI